MSWRSRFPEHGDIRQSAAVFPIAEACALSSSSWTGFGRTRKPETRRGGGGAACQRCSRRPGRRSLTARSSCSRCRTPPGLLRTAMRPAVQPARREVGLGRGGVRRGFEFGLDAARRRLSGRAGRRKRSTAFPYSLIRASARRHARWHGNGLRHGQGYDFLLAAAMLRG